MPRKTLWESLKEKLRMLTAIANKIKSRLIYVNYKRMWIYVKPVWFRALCSLLVCIPVGAFDAVIAMALKPYMDLVIAEKNLKAQWYVPLVIIALTSIQGGFKYLSAYLSTWVGNKITNELKLALFKKLLTLPTAFYDKRNSGDIVFQFNNMADAACNGLLNNIGTFVKRIFSSISLIFVLLYNSWQLTFVAIVTLICAFSPVAKIQKRVRGIMEQTVAADSSLITEYNEVFNGNKTIASYNLAKREIGKFTQILNNTFKLRIKIVQRSQWLSPLMHIIVSIGIAVTVTYGSFLTVSNQITPGNLVSFITALILLYNPIKDMGNTLNQVYISFFSMEKTFEILDTDAEIKDCETPKTLGRNHNEIQFKNVNFEYVANTPVLKNINFQIKQGETIAFVGNSGGGKTTITSLLPRFYDIKSGSITIDGTDIRDYSLESLRENIAVVFQDNFLFSGTIRENILVGRKDISEEDIHRTLEMAYLSEFVATLPHGLETQIGERGILLSGGQKQRVAIARAFLKNAPILILDEATSALDNKAEKIVQKAIDNLMKDKTVLVIAHRLSTIQNADRIAVINEGRLVELGNHEELMSIENGQYKMLYDMQFKSNK